MNIEELRLYCLAKPGVDEGFPFDEDTLVFKVMGKIFLLTSLENPVRMNLKCEPNYALELREEWPDDIIPGFHMNKTHWNTVYFNGRLRDTFLHELIDHSYDRVAMGLKKADKEALKKLRES